MRPIIKAVNECEEALQARSQQGTLERCLKPNNNKTYQCGIAYKY